MSASPPPPRRRTGTGKTEVIACLVKHVLAAAGGGGRLLLCAPSNFAVDELTRRLVAGGRHFKNGTKPHTDAGRHRVTSTSAHLTTSTTTTTTTERIYLYHPVHLKRTLHLQGIRSTLSTLTLAGTPWPHPLGTPNWFDESPWYPW